MILDYLLRLRDGGSAVTTTEAGKTTLTQGSGSAVVPIAKTALRGLAAVVVTPVGGIENASGSQVIVTLEASDAKTYTTVFSTSHSNLKFTSKQKGNPDISITYTDAGTNTLAVVVSGSDIVITLGHDDAVTSIASDLKALIEADAAANALVSVSYPVGEDGTGLVEALGIIQFWDIGAIVVATFPDLATSSNDAPIVASLMVRRFHADRHFVRSVITITSTLATGVNPDIFIGDMLPEED